MRPAKWILGDHGLKSAFQPPQDNVEPVRKRSKVMGVVCGPCELFDLLAIYALWRDVFRL